MKIQDLSNSNLYYDQGKCFGIVSNLNYLSPSKFLVDHNTFNVKQSRIIPVYYHENKITSTVKFIANSEVIIFQFNCDYDLNNKSFVINWNKSDFKCLSCKSHFNINNNLDQCCSLIDAPVQLFDAKIESIIIAPEDYLEEIRQCKINFINLHFSSIIDTIIL